MEAAMIENEPCDAIWIANEALHFLIHLYSYLSYSLWCKGTCFVEYTRRELLLYLLCKK